MVKKKLDNIKYIAFDMDGTLYTSDGILVPAYYKGIDKYNEKYNESLSKPTVEELEYQIGQPVRIIFKNLFPEITDESKLVELSVFVLDSFLEMISNKGGRIFDNVAETLEALKQKGYELFVASNGRHQYLEAILSAFNLKKYFHDVVSINDDTVIKKSDILLEYMNKYDFKKDDLLMVGDRSSDVEAANDVDCLFVGCNYGFAANEIENAEIIIHNLSELLEYL